ncbi:primosomal protein N' [Betaproteobacteria bacterium]|nr:primosomal protein N' [Betaproteobacteria bacterium]GHU42509.1 primosomal protein N' [Betaproteobacteria bacterium]
MTIARLALDVPLYRLFDYLVEDSPRLQVGLRVKAPFGNREKIGVIVELAKKSELPPEQLKTAALLDDDLPPLTPDFFRLCEFASQYYQAPLGEVILQALPPGLKKTHPAQRRARKPKAGKPVKTAAPLPELNAEQEAAVQAVKSRQDYAPFLLYGVTGSGKTEVYLRLIAATLAKGKQTLLLAPEINLTPQLETRLMARFPNAPIVMLHSDLGEAARERAWRAAFQGEARIVVGTRLSVFTPLPDLGLIIVDEEHDASYKQQDGMRYSARDLAVFRARLAKLPIVLGSATPSLESWAHAGHGRYTLLTLQERAVSGAKLPAIRILDTRRVKLSDGLSPQLIEALRLRLAAKEQSLVFLNRRGYAPVLACPACGWISRCPRCAANRVVHLADQRLRCHHCGLETPIPRACPTCGNQDILPFGRGTQRLESMLTGVFPTARILRVDRDSAKSRTQWEALLAKIQAGAADILVGTQMLAKGHDFPRLTLVGVVGADAALFAADWRAPERLFAQLMQVSGRAGRADLPGEVILQSEYPEHPLYRAITTHDYPGYAETLLNERRQAGFPPYAYQAILRAEAAHMETALAFLHQAANLPCVEDYPDITLYDPIPMRLFRLMNQERAQLLLESPSRPQLQDFLPVWRETLATLPRKNKLRWHIEVDPLEF